MRRAAFLLLGALVVFTASCGDDDDSSAPIVQYDLIPPEGGVSVGQDSTVSSGIIIVREGVDTIQNMRLLYRSANSGIATVDLNGNIRGVSGGQTVITATGVQSTVQVPVTVRGHPATSVELSVLSGPGGSGNIIGTRLTTNLDTGTFYALPADPGSSRLKAVVRVGDDTVYCNYCVPKTPARVQRIVIFRSLDTLLATVANATDPTAQDAAATAGRVTPRDTSSNGVKIVLEVPADNRADTVTLFLKLRPIDTLRVRPDSNFFPAANGTGLSKQIYQNADTIQANVVQSSNTNFIAGITYLSRVRDLPAANSSTSPTAASLIRTIPITPTGGVTVRRPNLPPITWESANVQYLQINAAGAVVAPCAYIGGACPSQGSAVLTCNSESGAMPATFLGQGLYTIPSCTPPKSIPFPGALCTTSSSTDLSSTCTIWIRASAIDPATGKLLQRLYRINVRR